MHTGSRGNARLTLVDLAQNRDFLNKFITCYRCYIGYRVYVLAIDDIAAIYSGQTVDIVVIGVIVL